MSEDQNPWGEGKPVPQDIMNQCMIQQEKEIKSQFDYSYKSFSESTDRTQDFINNLLDALAKSNVNIKDIVIESRKSVEQSFKEFVKNK